MEASYFQLEYTVDMLTQDLTHQLETTAALYSHEKAQKESLSGELARCHQRIADLEKGVMQARERHSSNTDHGEHNAGGASSGEQNQNEMNKLQNMFAAAKQECVQASQERQQLEAQLERTRKESSAAIQEKNR